MAEVVLFHHAQGLTAGCLSFAELADGMGYVKEVGFGTIIERGRLAAESLPSELVYAGMSLGVLPAQMLAQTRPGAAGALLLHAAIPLSEFGGSWPEGVPLQIHTMEDDDLGDADVARELAGTVAAAELFLYPGDRHLFTDAGLPDYDESAAALVRQRALAFLDAV